MSCPVSTSGPLHAYQCVCVCVCVSGLSQGTIDALWSDEDKVRMLEACARVVARPHGVIVSVSFASPVRLRLLWTHARRLNLCLRVYITAKGDPARGHEVG